MKYLLVAMPLVSVIIFCSIFNACNNTDKTVFATIEANGNKTELYLEDVTIHHFTEEEQVYIDRLNDQKNQKQMEPLEIKGGWNKLASVGLYLIWEDGMLLTDEEMRTRRECIHGMGTGWACDLCPDHQKVYKRPIIDLENDY